MSNMLFMAIAYTYVVAGIYLAAVAYVTDNNTVTIGAQYFKMLIMLLLWPLFFIFVPSFRRTALKIAKKAPILNPEGGASPSSLDNGEYWRDLGRFLDRKYLFDTTDTSTSRARVDTNTRYYFQRRAARPEEFAETTQRAPEESRTLTTEASAPTR